LRKKISKILAWVFPILVVITIWLVLRRPGGPPVKVDPEAAQSFEQKLGELVEAHARGQPAEVRMTESEVNSEIHQIMAGATASGPTKLSDVTVRLTGNQLESVLTVDVLGLNDYITLGGRLSVQDQRLNFDLTKVRMGSMPAPASVIGEVLRERLQSPAMRDMMRMPEFVKDVRVENSELVVESR
jgi:hypothetical protein